MSEVQVTTQGMVQEPVKGTTEFFAFNHPTPVWANVMFAIEFWLNKAVLIWLTGTHLIKPEHVSEVILACTVFDGFVWGIAKSFGIKPPVQAQ